MNIHVVLLYFAGLSFTKLNLCWAEENIMIMDSFREGDAYVPECMRAAKEQVHRAIKRTKLYREKNDIWTNPMDLFEFFKSPPNAESADIALAGDVFETAVEFVSAKIHANLRRVKRRVNATDMLSSETIKSLAKFAGCMPNRKESVCPDACYANMFRQITGECNNRYNRHWGASNNPLARWLPSQYENGFNLPTGWDPGRLRNGFRLPLVRKVSNDIIHTSNQNVTDDALYSHMLVVWGQYIDHDFDLTPQSLSTSTFQGLTNCKKTCVNEFPCFPIQVPPDDPRITDVDCMPFFRSSSVCGSGETSSLFNRIMPREQLNVVTSFVDASTVYGSNAELAYKLRDLRTDDGLMKINNRFRDGNREYLPFNEKNPCVQDPSDASGELIPCFDAGDGRVSEHLTLSAIHTLWVREHNRIARMLKSMNAHWNGERIYQEARKIVGSLHQVVQYREYIPAIVGEAGLRMIGEYTGYDAAANPSVSNVFATAAFRFGHVTIAPMFRRLNTNFEEHTEFKNILLHRAFFSPWRIIREGGLDPIFRGLIGRPAKLIKPNQIMHEELREKLFLLQNKVALDLASLNLQRGRDHALPHYNDWREFCNMSRASSFDDVAEEIKNAEIRRKLEELYGHPGNVDLWLAGLAETSVDGSRVGPTFMCLLSKQFKYQRDGDRFFYLNDQVHTERQREALENVRLSNVLCANSGLDRVQNNVFTLADFPAEFTSCGDLPPIDLEPWRESPEVDPCGRPMDIEHGHWGICRGGIVSYFCNEGYMRQGAEEIRCLASSRWDRDPPMCNDINECEEDNGSCDDGCVNTDGSYRCECGKAMMLNPGGKSCSPQPMTESPSPAANVPAIVIGVILGLAILVFLVASTFGIYKYMKLRIMMKCEDIPPEYRISDGMQANTIGNPGALPQKM